MCLRRTVWFLFFKLLLFQTLLVWCNARLVSVNNNNFYNGGDFSDNYNNKKILSDSLETNDVRSFYTFSSAPVSGGNEGAAAEAPAPSRNPPEDDSDSDEDVSGLYARGHVAGASCEVTVPVRVTADGAFLSRTLRATHGGTGARTRRSLRPGDVLGPEDAPDVHYNITVGGRALRLDLRPESEFISPHLVVERHGAGTQWRGGPEGAEACHFRGQVAGQPRSHVALSACHGLAGLLRTEHGEYWLEPSRKPPEEGEGHRHVLYKRSAVGRRREGGGNGGGGKGRRRKGRRGKKWRRKRKNCGTKQPPRQDALPRRVQWSSRPGRLSVQETRLDVDSTSTEEAVRKARSVSRPRHVEVLLVADSSMTDFHQKGNVETYLLTIMNMVSTLYLDPTIGNYINIVVVKIILLEEAGELNITTNADTTLGNFCRWQRELNPADDEHPNHHDVAILITRKDICARQNVPCSTLGVAHVAGMCLPDRSCSVNEDNGITLAHTITHELGHNFGMYHDTEKIGCHRRVGSTLHVMTPIFEADTVEVAWSRCSRRDLTNFLDSGMGECLADEPAQVDYIYPELPPGALYDAARQCRLQFGAGVEQVCTPLDEICQRLWCMVNGTCTTMLRPAAPGTECGLDMWCQNHTCVARTSPPPPQHGGWGPWGAWSACSRSCGAGVSVTRRLCDSPRPSHGGTFCTGERTRYKVCNTDPCPKNESSFRQVQCSKYDNTTYNGKLIERWQPYFDQDEPCELYCSTADESMIVPFGEYALDGTPCNLGTRDMCISGICRKVGCDWLVDSTMVEDSCGICGGNDTECKHVQGIYSMDTTKESGYSEVAIIPAGSKNIKIEEVANSKNYIGIVSTTSRKFYLNGRRKITLAGEYLVAGTPALYERDRDWEKVRIPGPIEEDILVYQMIYRGRHRNPGVRYQYTVDPKRSRADSRYQWGTSAWTPCSRSCGGGLSRRPVVCLDANAAPGAGAVDIEHCVSNSEIEKPSELMRVCNPRSCRTFWWVGPWSACPCGRRGQGAQRRRSVQCRERADNSPRSDTDCDRATKPAATLACLSVPKCDTRY